MNTMLNDAVDTAKTAFGTAKTGAEHAVDAAKQAVDTAKGKSTEAASTVRSTFLEKVTAVSGVIAMLRSLGVDDALGWVGLARRRNGAASLGMFGAGFAAGAAVGAGAGLLLAPQSGAELRSRIARGIEGFGKDSQKTVENVEAKVEAKVEDLTSKAKETATKVRDVVTHNEQELEAKVDKATGTTPARPDYRHS